MNVERLGILFEWQGNKYLLQTIYADIAESVIIPHIKSGALAMWFDLDSKGSKTYYTVNSRREYANKTLTGKIGMEGTQLIGNSVIQLDIFKAA